MSLPNLLQGFGLEMILIVEIGYLWIHSVKNRNTATLSAFFQLCSALMLFLIINIPVRITDLELVHWDSHIVFVLNALFIALQTLTAFEWFVYFLTVKGEKITSKHKALIAVPLYLMLLLLAISYKTRWLFDVNESGVYTRGSLFFMQILIPYLYMIASLAVALIAYKKDKNTRWLSVFSLAFFTTTVTSVLQVFFSGSFTHAGLSMAVILLYIEMYQYEIKQMEKMRSLAGINAELEATNAALSKTIHELEISVENEKAANNAKNDFLSRMSHDIRTPINGILGLIEINERHPNDVTLLAANRQKAQIAAKHLLSLINDVLDMSKLTSGKYEFSHEPFVISQLMKEVCSIANTSAEAAGITLIYENENDPSVYPATYGSPLHISRALLNIVGNAIKYNKKGGCVRVGFTCGPIENEKIPYTITVSDTGIGMSKDYMQKLFEPFSQERIDARSSFSGYGLGMAITKALIEGMGGSIDVKSEVGAGTTFRISLIPEIAPDRDPVSREIAEKQDLNGMHILLAEDNELNIEIAKELLEDSGAVVEVAENGLIACEKFRSNPEGTYDVILMDCMMPVMDGFEATGAIRKTERPDAASIPIIAMTANAFTEDVKKCMDAGMNAHLPKPFSIEKVIGTIRKYVIR